MRGTKVMDIVMEHEPDTLYDSLPALAENDEVPIDILDRQETVTQLMELLTALSNLKSSCTFALNGKWGVGKTFVLNMVERQLREYQAGEKFAVFHYNCWEYDYYDEPLIAIVSSMLDSIDEYTQFFSGEVKEKLQSGFVNTAKQVMKKVACSFIENKVGIDADDLSDFVEKVQEATSQENHEQHEYNKYYAFHKVVENAREELSKLAENQTLVIVVDELDRCLPNYAIKILERLHHLFSELNNIIVVLAIDGEQLDNTVSQIFGDKVDTNSYLKKFIDFEVPLGLGKVNGGFVQKYSDYISLFRETPSDIQLSIEDYLSALFSGVNIRTQERLMDRIRMVHNLLFTKETKDYSFMCLELMILVFPQFEEPIKSMPFRIDARGGFDLYFSNEVPDQLRKYLKDNWKITSLTHVLPEDNFQFKEPIGIPELMVWYSQELYGAAPQAYKLPTNIQNRFVVEGYIEGLKYVNQLLDTIR